MNDFTYDDAVCYMEGSAKRGSILGLTRIKKLCDILGNPQDELKFIHVAGTNGKGSTACMIASILKTAGYKAGMYYSPAMTGIKDHFAINGELIADEEYAFCVKKLKEANEQLYDLCNEEATQFELETALAFLYFYRSNCDVVILETGMGGRDDATNIVKNKLLCVFTSISLDHTAILGNTIYEIAKVKAGIITSWCPVVAYDSSSDVITAIKEEAGLFDCPVRVVSGRLEGYDLALKGRYQEENALVSYTAIDELRKLGFDINDAIVAQGFKEAYWPYRFENIKISPRIYVDGAHNPDAALKLKDAIMDSFGKAKIIMVLGMFKDKDYEKVISTLVPLANSVYAVTVSNKERALDAVTIKYVSDKYCDNVFVCDDIIGAVEQAICDYNNQKKSDNEAVIIACGSLSYLAKFKECVNETCTINL